ncbi:MAG TPA: carbon-nitrogen hydrolase family protein [Parvularculaceae bacterium]|nr:carbon-nitrogen hydrolase family protein [Parvularculaceae bacterium]
MSKRIIGAVVQAGSALFDTPRTMEKFADFASKSASQGAELAVFPEAFIGGYPKGHQFGTVVGTRTAEGRDWFRRYHESAIDIPGPETAEIARLAKDLGLDLVVGVVERAAKAEGGGTLYCAALCFSRDGAFLGKRRKLMPTAAERLIWGFGDGSTLDIFDAPSGRVSVAICWENYMPMLRMNFYAQGAELYCAPTVDERENWTSTMRTIAVEGRCFVLSACQYLTHADAPADYLAGLGDTPKKALINGGSVIISPLGAILAGPKIGEEAILTAELDFAEIIRGKMDFDVAGHYARPDVFRLLVNRARQRAVSDEE